MKLGCSVAALGATLTATWLARAQPPESPPEPGPPAPLYTVPGAEEPAGRKSLPAPSNAFELSLATGYTQGLGSLQSGVGMPSVATVGAGFDLGLGYRIDPHWAVLLAGQFQELTGERTADVRGLTGTVAAQYHFTPQGSLDPWLEAGAGYRFLWEDPRVGSTLMTHGFQLARVRAGLDFRVDQNVALGPIVGADANLFLFQDFPRGTTNIDDPRLSTFIYAGLQGRFDLGGQRESAPAPRTAASQR